VVAAERAPVERDVVNPTPQPPLVQSHPHPHRTTLRRSTGSSGSSLSSSFPAGTERTSRACSVCMLVQCMLVQCMYSECSRSTVGVQYEYSMSTVLVQC
jgi:hypothetical protein